MDNPEFILQSLEHFPKLKDDKDYSIPIELEEYIHYVAKTGDPVFQWTLVKPLFREKIIKVISDFFESNPGEIPDYPNVTKFNYDSMKETLLERIDWFKGAPFTIQRISELLVNPTKEYNRVDKYMRALEKNIYVVSTREPGMPQPVEENNATFDESFILNGNDFDLKSDNNDDSGSKDEEESGDAAALLLLKKCSNGESDNVTFNIEVDVTNTTPSEDTQEDSKLDSADINIHEESTDATETSYVSESKCGQTRKLEEDEQLESDPKRFKLDEGESKADDIDISEGEDMNVEEIMPETEVNSQSKNESDTLEVISQSKDTVTKTKIDIEMEKVDVEMEIEESVINKIESFDNNKSGSSLDISEGDSMVISQESGSGSEDNIDKSMEDNIDAVVSESSDMDLSDGVSTVDLKTTEISALLDLPESDENTNDKHNNVEVDSTNLLEGKPEEKPADDISSNSNSDVETTESNNEEISSSSETEKCTQNEINSSEVTASESISKEETYMLHCADDEVDTSATSESQVSTLKKEVDEKTTILEQTTVINKPKSDVDSTEESQVESSTEINVEIEEAILEEDEFENPDPEEAESNVDPLSTESEAEPLVEEVDTAVEEKTAVTASENPTESSTLETSTELN